MADSVLPIFDQYVQLSSRIPYIPVAQLPTPVRKLERLARETGTDLWLKDDGPSGALYGGNKVRKLGFLLASARQDGAATVLTFGAAGSNHALATAIYAHDLGLKAVSMLVPQPTAKSIRRNLLRQLAAEAEIHYRNSLRQVALATLWRFTVESAREGKFPRVIPTGGSSPVGILGFVNAAFELKKQIDAGELPAPDLIYVASGTMGTAVGLALGARLAGLSTRIVAVRVTAESFTNIQRGKKLFTATNEILHGNDPGVPIVPFPEETFEIRHEFLGQQYALYTPEGVAAVNRVRDSEDLRLEGTYTGKAMACLLEDAASARLSGKRVLFWNTHNSVDFSDRIRNLDYHRLPGALHRYFTDPLQPLESAE